MNFSYVQSETFIDSVNVGFGKIASKNQYAILHELSHEISEPSTF